MNLSGDGKELSAKKVYRYECDDRSILLPWAEKYLLEPIAALTARRFSAASVTVLASACSMAAFLLCFLFPVTLAWPGFLAGIFVVFYVLLDNLDGKVARNQGGGTAHGEFLDHGLDALTSGFVVAAVSIRLDWPEAFGLNTVIAGTYVTTASLAWYEKQTGKVYFNSISPFESALLAAILLAISGPLELAKILSNFTPRISMLLWCTIALLSVKDAVGYIRKTGSLSTDMVLFLLMMFGLILFGLVAKVNSNWLVVLTGGFGAWFSISMLESHLTGSNVYRFVFLIPLVVLAVEIAPGGNIGWLGAGFMGLIAIWRFLNALLRMRQLKG